MITEKLSIRPLTEQDIPYLINYFFGLKDEDLLRMGMDKTKLEFKENITQILLESTKVTLDLVKSFYMIWLLDNKPVGFNSLKNISQGNIADMHLHMWDADLRGKGYGAQFFCLCAVEFYRIFHLKMILCEPAAVNPMPNRMLTKIGFAKWKTYLSKSSDLSLVCELNSYVVDQKISSDFLNNR